MVLECFSLSWSSFHELPTMVHGSTVSFHNRVLPRTNKSIYWNWSSRFHSAFCEEQTQKIYRKWLQVPLRFANKQTESRSTGIDCTSFIVFCEETKIKHDLKGIDCRYHHLLRTTNTKHLLELIAGSIAFWEEANTKHLLELILQVPWPFGKNKQKASTGIALADSFAFWKNEHKA